MSQIQLVSTLEHPLFQHLVYEVLSPDHIGALIELGISERSA